VLLTARSVANVVRVIRVKPRRKRPWSHLNFPLASLWLWALSSLVSASAWAAGVSCGTGGDAAGWAIASGKDFDGDGVADLAVGAPCASVGGAANVGRVFVYSGVTGRRILTLKGLQQNEKFGGALEFIDDLNGDSRAELMVGSLGWNVPISEKQSKTSAGKVTVFSLAGAVLKQIEGEYANGNFGEAVTAIADVDGDEVPDFVVGAGNDRAGPLADRYGAAYLISGFNGQRIDVSLGESTFDQWGTIVGRAGDVDGDGLEDVLVSSHLFDRIDPITLKRDENNGLVRILSGADFSTVLFEAWGRPEDKLGRWSTMVGDFDRDGTPDVAAGAPGVRVGNKGNAGEVAVFSSATGERLSTLTEPNPQQGAGFGSAVVGVGLIDRDKVPDLVVAAPAATVKGFSNAGRYYLISGATGTALWTTERALPGARAGQALATMHDFDGDGYLDVAVGSPGDAFRGKRGAGIVDIVSGKTGRILQSVGGQVGTETRLFLAGRGYSGDAELRNLTSFGRTTRARQEILRGVRDGEISLSLFEETDKEELKIAIAAGRGATSPWVEVRRARRGRGIVSRFVAEFSEPYSGGVNVATGQLTDDPGEELVVVQAQSATGSVDLSIYARLDTDPFGRITWVRRSSFPVFASGEHVDGFPVNADGATVAVGSISNEPQRIVVGSGSGTAVVRVFDEAGVVLSQWLAYPTQGASGVAVTIGNIDAGSSRQIVTVPLNGQLRVRAFNANGTPFIASEFGTPVDFVVPSPLVGFATSFRVAVADVDLDNRGEILIVPSSGNPCDILAFEANGTLVEGWPGTVCPRWSAASGRLALVTTDRFLTRR
jgi:hypothetical protein